jgi:hypothetical protein
MTEGLMLEGSFSPDELRHIYFRHGRSTPVYVAARAERKGAEQRAHEKAHGLLEDFGEHALHLSGHDNGEKLIFDKEVGKELAQTKMHNSIDKD